MSHKILSCRKNHCENAENILECPPNNLLIVVVIHCIKRCYRLRTKTFWKHRHVYASTRFSLKDWKSESAIIIYFYVKSTFKSMPNKFNFILYCAPVEGSKELNFKFYKKLIFDIV